MPLKRMLVHYDNTERSNRALDAALDLADLHDAHLIGCGVETYPTVPGFIGAQVPADVYDSIAKETRAALEKAEQSFNDRCRKAGREDRSEWLQVTGDPAHAIATAGRCTDVIVIGQSEPKRDPANIEVLADDLVLTAGRPILVIPYIGVSKKPGRRVLVAWTNTREAARAVMDALPVLQQADSVNLLTINPEEGDMPASDIARWLSEHGVEAEINRIADGGIEVGEQLLNQVSDTDADMIVMGAYGHSRLRETVLGGATRTVLRHMTVPVMMSH